MAFLQAGVRRLALQLPRSSSFVCRQCLQADRTAFSAASAPSARLGSIVRSARGFATARSQPPPPPQPQSQSPSQSPLGALSSKVASSSFAGSASGTAGKKKAFPETSSKAVGYWLIGSAASVFGIVVWGGLTRLTESGLSITEWRPVTGSLPPLSQADWESEFEKYRASPEYAKLNPNMDLDEFKKIYFMEWSHRLWGRLVGLTFVAPAVYFVARRRVTARMTLNLAGISALIGFQGFIGWWMVASGLKDDLFAPGAHPRVSQYRLTAHLATAFVCYSWMLVAGLGVLRTHRLLADPAAASKLAAALRSPALAPFRRYATALAALVFLTAMSGALVAGLDAGLIYNEFPKMGKGLTPPSSELWDRFYSRKEDGSDLWWRNMLENPSLVQLDHRILATTTCVAVLALFFYSRRPAVLAALPRGPKKATTGLVHLMLLQVTLGITTLMYMVPIPLAAAHQAGALALLTGALVLGQRLRVPPSTLALIQRRLKDIKK